MKNWLVSRYKHARFKNFKEHWCWPISNKKTINWINTRNNHYRNVVDFFNDKSNKLIIVNIEKRGWEKFVINKIDKNINFSTNFKCNVSNYSLIKHKIKLINDNVLFCLNILDYSPDELFIKNDDILNYPYNFYL